MGQDAPDPRAKALADKLKGQPAETSTIIDLIAGNVNVGKRDEEGRPVGDKVSAEDYRRGRSGKLSRSGTDESDDEVDEEEDDNTEEEDTDTEEDDEEGSDLDAEEADDEPDDDEETEEDDGQDYEEVAYSDEDELDVTVDGETKAVSLRELKRVYSLNEATEKRLKEATNARTEAQQEREKAQTETQEQRLRMLQTIQQLDGVMFAPMVDEPDPKLRARNIQEYLLQKDAWEEDQKRIAKGREDLTKMLHDEAQAGMKTRLEYRQSQQKILAEKMPELLDPQKAPKVQADILSAAAHYGFSAEMVATADHHGLFLMARDAARWLNMQKLKANGGIPTGRDSNGKLKRKRLRAGGVAATKTRLVKSQKQQKVAETKARSTGRVDDVANMLVSKARSTRGEPNGRPGKNV